MSSETQTGAEVKMEKGITFPCPSCGGALTFNPGAQDLTCVYCGSKVEIPKDGTEIKEYDLAPAMEKTTTNWGVEKRVFKCGKCGAETVYDATTAAALCAFCGSPLVAENNVSAGIAPESLVAFKVPQAKAVQLFAAWLKKRFFAPSALKINYRLEKMTGIYIPCWTYDADTSSYYEGEGGTYYWETETDWVTENGERKQVTRQVRKISVPSVAKKVLFGQKLLTEDRVHFKIEISRLRRVQS